MNPEQMEQFFAVLTIAAMIGTVVLVACRFLAGRVAFAADVVDHVRPFAMPIGALVALTSMGGSLYFSEVANFVPCTLCWYQRIAMYPLGLILAIAAVRRDRSIRYTAVPLAGIGAAISLYHYLLERFPDLESGICSATVPCNFVWFETYGFITLPFMALVGFVSVIALVTLPAQEPQS